MRREGGPPGSRGWAPVRHVPSPARRACCSKTPAQTQTNGTAFLLFHLCRLDERRRSFTLLDWLAFFVPFAGWIRTYERSWLQSDVLAGLSVACMEIPQVWERWVICRRSPPYMCIVSTCGGLPLWGLCKVGADRPLLLNIPVPCPQLPPNLQAGHVVRLPGRPASFFWAVRCPGALPRLHALLNLATAGASSVGSAHQLAC